MAAKSHPSRPDSYPHKLLIVVSGESPQVITETLFALATSDPAFHPTRTLIITTALGRERVLESMWGEQKQLEKLLTSYKLGDPGLVPDNIRVPANAAGVADSDAHSEEALDRMGNLILATLCAEGKGDVAIHVSLAGGRKTMSYLAGLALSLVGRPQDRLSHVVLSDPRFERRDFYFPPIPPVALALSEREIERGEKPLWTEDVSVRIVDVLFVRLRELLGEDLVNPAHERPLTELVTEANAALTEPEQAVVEFDTHMGIVVCNGVRVKFPPALLAFYYFLARRGVLGLHARASDEECLGYLDDYSHVLEGGAETRQQGRYLDRVAKRGDKLFGEKELGEQCRDSDGRWRSIDGRGPTIYGEILDLRANIFNPDFTNTNKTLRKFLGQVRAQPFLIQSRQGHYTFPEDVQIVWKDARPRRQF